MTKIINFGVVKIKKKIKKYLKKIKKEKNM